MLSLSRIPSSLLCALVLVSQGSALAQDFGKYATPGEKHKLLEPMAGKWNFEVKFWMDPNAEPMTSTGTGENKWIFGNRYLVSTAKGTFGEMEFHGTGMTGYDLFRNKYVSTWCDNFTTEIQYVTGTVDSTGKVFTFTGEFGDPQTGKLTKKKDITKIIDNDKHISESYVVGEGGKEMKIMEIVFTRAK